MTLSNAAVAGVLSTALVLALSLLPPEASALPREREAFYKWSPRYDIKIGFSFADKCGITQPKRNSFAVLHTQYSL